MKTHEDLFVSVCGGGGLIDYGEQGTMWEVEPSHCGGFFISTHINGRKYFWQADEKNRMIVKLHDGCDNWESFKVQQHPSGSGFAFWNVGMQRFLCAEPASHGIHLIADRSAALEWERFNIEVEGEADRTRIRNELATEKENARKNKKALEKLQREQSKADEKNKADMAAISAAMAALETECNSAKSALEEIADPRRSALVLGEIWERVFEHAKTAGKAKDPRPALIVLGPTASGKSTLLNKLFCLDLRTGQGRVTQGCNAMASWRGLVIYDVFGNNDVELYLQWEAVEKIVGKHIALVCFENTPESARNATRLCVSAGVRTIMIWTKADSLHDMSNAQARVDEAARDYGALCGVVVSAERDRASVDRLRDVIDVSRTKYFEELGQDPGAFPDGATKLD